MSVLPEDLVRRGLNPVGILGSGNVARRFNFFQSPAAQLLALGGRASLSATLYDRLLVTQDEAFVIAFGG